MPHIGPAFCQSTRLLRPAHRRSRSIFPDDFACADGEHAANAAVAHQLVQARIHEAEFPFLNFQHGDVGDRALAQVTQVRPVDRTGGVHCRALDDLVHAQADVEQLRHGRGHVGAGQHDAALVNVGGDGVGQKALLNGGDRIAKEEAARAMADVEQYAALARRQSVGGDLLVLVEQGVGAAVEVRVNVAGAQVFQEQVGIGRCGFCAKSTMTGLDESLPASTARSTASHVGGWK